VRAVLGHWLLGYVHPCPDGNGRIARFLMNTLLASGGYPWTVIRVDDRAAYLDALETASVGADVRPFARFVAQQMQRQAELPPARKPRTPRRRPATNRRRARG
jgi:Fic family protein